MRMGYRIGNRYEIADLHQERWATIDELLAELRG